MQCGQIQYYTVKTINYQPYKVWNGRGLPFINPKMIDLKVKYVFDWILCQYVLVGPNYWSEP